MDLSEPKITIVGAGSVLTLKLLGDFYRVNDLWGSELVLYDIGKEKLKVMYTAVKKYVERTKAELKVHMTTNKKEALENANSVIIAIRAGGLRATRLTIEIPFKYGAIPITGDTTGPSGLLKAITEIPAIMDIIRTLEDVSPKAIVLNHTNPVTAVCTAVSLASKINIIGMCHGYPLTKFTSALLNLDYKSLKSTVAGINHLTWLVDITYKGESILDELKDAVIQGRNWKVIKNHPYLVGRQLLKTYGMLVSVSDRHTAEFFHYLHDWLKDPIIGKVLRRVSRIVDYEKGTLSSEYLREREEAWKKVLRVAEGKEKVEPSDLLYLDIISSMVNNIKREIRIANIPNDSYIDGIRNGRIVEVPCIVDGSGIRGKRVGRLTRAVLVILNLHLEKFEILAKGVLEKDKDLILEAMGLDPTTPSPEKAEAILNEYLSAINPLQ